MRISGQPQISLPESKLLKQVTTTRRGDKRGTDVNIIGSTSSVDDNAYIDSQFSDPLAPGATDFHIYANVPANVTRTVLAGVFTSTVYFKVELMVDGVSIYTIFGKPFDTLSVPFKGFKLPAGETLTIKYTNMSSNPVTASIYSSLSFSDEDL